MCSPIPMEDNTEVSSLSKGGGNTGSLMEMILNPG